MHTTFNNSIHTKHTFYFKCLYHSVFTKPTLPAPPPPLRSSTPLLPLLYSSCRISLLLVVTRRSLSTALSPHCPPPGHTSDHYFAPHHQPRQFCSLRTAVDWPVNCFFTLATFLILTWAAQTVKPDLNHINRISRFPVLSLPRIFIHCYCVYDFVCGCPVKSI